MAIRSRRLAILRHCKCNKRLKRLQGLLRNALSLNHKLIRQLNDASSDFVVEKRSLEQQLQLLTVSNPPVEELPLSAAAVFSDASAQTDLNWTEALVREVHYSNARRFRAEALLRAAGLGRIPANQPWELHVQRALGTGLEN